MSTPPFTVRHDPKRRSFETPDGAHLTYSLHGDRASFDHTFVPPSLRGQGHAAALTRFALAHARNEGWQVEPSCSYVRVFLERHPDLAAGSLRDGRPVIAPERG